MWIFFDAPTQWTNLHNFVIRLPLRSNCGGAHASKRIAYRTHISTSCSSRLGLDLRKNQLESFNALSCYFFYSHDCTRSSGFGVRPWVMLDLSVFLYICLFIWLGLELYALALSAHIITFKISFWAGSLVSQNVYQGLQTTESTYQD